MQIYPASGNVLLVYQLWSFRISPFLGLSWQSGFLVYPMVTDGAAAEFATAVAPSPTSAAASLAAAEEDTCLI